MAFSSLFVRVIHEEAGFQGFETTVFDESGGVDAVAELLEEELQAFFETASDADLRECGWEDKLWERASVTAELLNDCGVPRSVHGEIEDALVPAREVLLPVLLLFAALPLRRARRGGIVPLS